MISRFRRSQFFVLVTIAAYSILSQANFIALAADTFWNLNGSKIRWESDGPNRKAYYVEPRTQLLELGVRPGQLLFEGARKGNRIEGYAYTFKKNCSPARFSVSADVISERQFVLEGLAPVRSEGGCGAASTTNISLKFDFIPPEESAGGPAPAGRVDLSASDIPKPSAGTMRKLNQIGKEEAEFNTAVAANQQQSSFTVCNGTPERVAVAFGRSGRVRGWISITSGQCQLIERFSNPTDVIYFAKSQSWNWSGDYGRYCIESDSFDRASATPCQPHLLRGFYRRVLTRNDHYVWKLNGRGHAPMDFDGD